MFSGDVVCHSKRGEGSNFVFIMALGESDLSSSVQNSSGVRILNPVRKEYQKIKVVPKSQLQ